MEDEITRRITALEDIEAIKRLKAEYCDICDDEHNEDRIASIFTEDGIWEGKGVGHAQGHAELRKLFKSFAERISFSQHNVFNRSDGQRGARHLVLHGPIHFP